MWMCVVEWVGWQCGWHVQCVFCVCVLAGMKGANKSRSELAAVSWLNLRSKQKCFFMFSVNNSLLLLSFCFSSLWHVIWPWSNFMVTQYLQQEGALDLRLDWLPLQFMCLLFWLTCWPVGPLVSWLDIVGFCAIHCSVNVLIKLSVFCSVLGHLPSAEPVLLLLLLLLLFSCFYFTVSESSVQLFVPWCLHMYWFWDVMQSVWNLFYTYYGAAVSCQYFT